MTASNRKTAGFLRETLLNVAALGGVVCIVLVALAFLFNITLIMFKTGSMSPTIPAGSVALVREIPASEMRVGDVVTVDRTEKLPITHRVTSIEAGTGESRTFTMRGDANSLDDVEPYTASTVRIVLGSVPGLANVIVWFSNPLVLGGITLAASVLVTWAFWPRDRQHDDDTGESDAAAGSPSPAPADVESNEVGRAEPAHRLSRTLGLAFVVAATSSALALSGAQPAQAAETETVVQGTVLRLVSIGDPELMEQLRPGIPVHWQIGVSADAPEPGIVTLGMSASGELAASAALHVAIDVCAVRWHAGACPSGAVSLVASQAVNSAIPSTSPNGIRDLTTMPSDEQQWLLLTVALDDAVAPGASATIVVHASGIGDEVASGGETGTLAESGSHAVAPLYLAFGAIGTGLFVAWLAALRRRRRA